MSNKLQNVKAVKELLSGAHKSQSRKTVGYMKGAEVKRNVGDTWTELDPTTGTVWKIEQKNGFRTRTVENSILQKIRDILTVPKECTCCGKEMRDEEKHLNFKMYFIHKKCFSCVTQEETLIRAKGNEAWEEYSRQRMLANAESWLRDADREVALLREALKVQFVQNADGGLEEWDQSVFFEKFDADYKQTRETILNNLKGTTNG
jgi:hypothetical protein